MKDRPILFSAPMVRALLEGRKTQTRRLAWRDAELNAGIPVPTIWQRVKAGELLWVRESLQRFNREPPTAQYVATLEGVGGGRIGAPCHPNGAILWGWKGPKLSSIYMPRWASRITLEVTAVGVQRLKDISEADALAEGTQEPTLRELGGDLAQAAWSERQVYARLWAHLHGQESWNANPEVVALTFIVHKQNIDALLKQRQAG